jgi:hypothetical protein
VCGAGYENVAKAYSCRAPIVFNHVSYSDGIILGAYLLPCGLAKASVADIPFFGAFAKACHLGPRAWHGECIKFTKNIPLHASLPAVENSVRWLLEAFLHHA